MHRWSVKDGMSQRSVLNELIGSSASTIRKFRFRIADKRQSQKIHQNIAVETTCIKKWATIGSSIRMNSVRSFHIVGDRHCNNVFSESLFTLLSLLPELEELYFENVRIVYGTDKNVQRLEIPRLKILRIVDNDFTILSRIGFTELQKLECIVKSNIEPSNLEWIAQSIVRCSLLQSLTLWNCLKVFEHIDVQQVNCRLTSFEECHIKFYLTDDFTLEKSLAILAATK